MMIKKKAWLMALILGSMALAACGGRSESKSSSQQQSQSSIRMNANSKTSMKKSEVGLRKHTVKTVLTVLKLVTIGLETL